MSTTVFLITAFSMFGTILGVFAMKYWSDAHQARSKAAATEAYQDLAQKAVTTQGQIALSLSTVQSDLAQIGARLASVEKVLKEVG